MFELRPYQREALSALDVYWSRGGGNPLATMATATGKSVIIAHLIRDISRRYPSLRVLVVAHVLELIRQDLEPLRCGRTRPSASTARASASANGTRRSSSPGCRVSGATLPGSVRDTWC
jgi:superfamily II DNA or RNA helicase